MRHFVNNVITAAEAQSLASEVRYLDFKDARLKCILDIVSGFFPVSYEDPSYVRVEHKAIGHPWHTDQGNTGHMAWCRYSAEVLLTEPLGDFTGGGFYFRDAPDNPLFPYLNLITWDGAKDNVHCAASHKGNRRVLIMFFGGA